MYVQVSLKMEIAATATLPQMEQHIQEAGQQAMREALQKTVRQWEDVHAVCPFCGDQQHRLEGTARRKIATTFGRVQVQRRRFRCQACQRRWCPATLLFAALKGATISQPLQDAAIQIGCSLPYRAACHQLRKLSGAQISPEEMRLLTNAYGKQRAQCQQQEAERLCATREPGAETTEEPKADGAPITDVLAEPKAEPVSAATGEPAGETLAEPGAASTSEAVGEHKTGAALTPALLVGMDGGWICSREQRGGMEGKVTVVCGKVEDLPMTPCDTTFSWSKRGSPRRPPRQRHRLAQRRYVATFGPSKQIGQQAEAAAHLVSQDPARPVVVIADGAAWIKTEQAKHFPQATCILDWAHLWREVRRALRAAARGKALSAQELAYQGSLHKSWLWHGEVEKAVQGLRTLAVGVSDEFLVALQKAITYLENQRPWINSYEHWRKQGYPVGSGMIERTVEIVINRRMKKRGMRWCRANATAVVALRADLLNDDWVTPQPLRAFP